MPVSRQHPLNPGADLQSVIVVQHDKNRGKGRAIRTGLEHVSCSHVIIQDADLEYDPADINKLWEMMKLGKVDVVYGSRYLNAPARVRSAQRVLKAVKLRGLLRA